MNLIPKPTTTNRFAVAESIYGFQVIDFDGRPVTDPLEWNTANQTRDDLNVAAYHGPRSLALALGCIDDEPEEDLA